MDRLAGKTALITGAARGLGAQIARRFVQEGASVIINDLNLGAAQAMADELGGHAVAADVSSSAAVSSMFDAVQKVTDRVDILVNNAGISGMEGRNDTEERFGRLLQQAEELNAGGPAQTFMDGLVETSDEDWQRMIGIHLGGTFYCSREVLARFMNAQMSGCIINMGSIMGTAGMAGAVSYSAAKAGIMGLTRALAREVALRNIRVNALAPGFIQTDMTDPLEFIKPLINGITPMMRFGDTDDIAWAAVYLASDEAKFVTGQVLSPNGGYHMSQ